MSFLKWSALSRIFFSHSHLEAQLKDHLLWGTSQDRTPLSAVFLLIPLLKHSIFRVTGQVVVKDPGLRYRQMRVQTLVLGLTSLLVAAHANEHTGTMVSTANIACAFMGLTVKGMSQIVEPINV